MDQISIRGARHASRSDPGGTLHDHRGGRAIASIANLPTGRTEQLLAVGILAAAIGSPYLLIAVPLQDLHLERQVPLEDRGMLASRLAVAAKELPTLRPRLAELRATASTSKVTLDGANDAIASANLQSRVEALATSLGVTLGSTEAPPAADRGGFRRIGLAMHGEYENLVRLFGAIDASVTPLVLDNLHIRSVMRPAGMPGSAKLDAGFEFLAFAATICRPALSDDRPGPGSAPCRVRPLR